MDNICGICIIDHRVAIATWNGRLCIVDASKITNPARFGLDLRGLPQLPILWETNFPEPAAYSMPTPLTDQQLVELFRADEIATIKEQQKKAQQAYDESLRNKITFSYKHSQRVSKMVYASEWNALFIANVAGRLYHLNLSTYELRRLADISFKNIFLQINDLALSSDQKYLYFVNRDNLWVYNIARNKFSILYKDGTDSLLACSTYQQGVAIVTKRGYCCFFRHGKEAQEIHPQPKQFERESSFKLKVLVDGKETEVNYSTPHPYPLSLDSCKEYFAFSYFSGEIIESKFIQKSTIVIVDKNFNQRRFEARHIVQKLLFIKEGKILLILTEEGELLAYDSMTDKITNYKTQIAHCEYNADLQKLITISTVNPSNSTQTITDVFAQRPALPPGITAAIADIVKGINALSSPLINNQATIARLKSIESRPADWTYCQDILTAVQTAIEADIKIATATATILGKIDELKVLIYNFTHTQLL